MSLGAPRTILVSDPDENDRRIYFDLRQTADPIAPAIGITGQPQISTNFGAYTNTGISTLTELSNGRYYATLTVAAISTVGSFIRTRFRDGSSTVVETPGDYVYVVPNDPGADQNAAIAAEVVASLSGNPGIIVLPTTSQQLTLSEAVELCRSALRDRAEDSDRTEDIKNAIRTLVSDFINKTPVNNTVATFTATIDDPVLDLSSVAGFRAERFIRAQIDYNDPLAFVDYAKVSRELDSSSDSGEPTMIAFDTATTAYVSPRPETAASIKIKYSLAANSLDSDTDTIQIPAEYLRPALWWGVPALLRGAAQEGDEGDRGWRRYMAIVRKLNGVGTANRGHFSMDLDKYN